MQGRLHYKKRFYASTDYYVERDRDGFAQRSQESMQGDMKQVEQVEDKRSWIQRNRGKAMALGAIGLLAVAAAVVIPVAVTQNANNDSGHNGLTGGASSSFGSSPHDNGGNQAVDNFDDSTKANEFTPALNEPFGYGKNKIRGVNLGGWLVIEPFITPSLFDQFKPEDNVIDEWGLCSKLGPDEAYRQLKKHYETFITEQDFKKMKDMGLNHVRIPTGHWAINPQQNEPFVPKLSWEYLLKGIGWARKYGLRVMVELHTAPGSQNGWNHSGRSGTVGFLNGTHGEENGKLTLDTVGSMINFFDKPEYAHVAPVFGVLNEPAMYRIETERVQQWYRQSYDMIRQKGPDSGPWLTYHEGFLGLPTWNGFFNSDDHYKRVILGKHDPFCLEYGTNRKMIV